MWKIFINHYKIWGSAVDESQSDSFEVPNGPSLWDEVGTNQNQNQNQFQNQKNKYFLDDDVIHKPIAKGEVDPN